MLAIVDSRVYLVDGKWNAKCVCGKLCVFANKASALKMLSRGACRNCKRDYRSVPKDANIYRNALGKWCSTCSGCGVEQAYTRKDHAKQSETADWQCKKCVAQAKGFNENKAVGDERRTYNKFRTSAKSRGLNWELTIDDMFSVYSGKCALTGWDLSLRYVDCNASLDRIDSAKGYVKGNIQWVHSMVNMCKNKYDQDQFVKMCIAVADKAKW